MYIVVVFLFRVCFTSVDLWSSLMYLSLYRCAKVLFLVISIVRNILTSKTTMVDIIPAQHQHVSVVIMRILAL